VTYFLPLPFEFLLYLVLVSCYLAFQPSMNFTAGGKIAAVVKNMFAFWRSDLIFAVRTNLFFNRI